MSLPKLITREEIRERLSLIFPEGTAKRNYCIREISASTIFTMIYVGAIDDTDVLISPKHVYSMTEEQSHLVEEHERIEYHQCILRRNCEVSGNRWYRDNTRESIRDETLGALHELGAVYEKVGIATTSSRPRYSLIRSFAELFNPDLFGQELETAIGQWQSRNLTRSALTRIRIANQGSRTGEGVLITFPNQETRHMIAGASSEISKHVIEVFARKFLVNPFVLWLSESGNKVHYRDDRLASELGILIDPQLNLPDIILVDIVNDNVLLVFTEVVATDGAVDEVRKRAIYEITDKAGYERHQVLFVTAYIDRQSAGFKKTITDVDWNTFIWFASEPDNIFILQEGVMKLADIISRLNQR